MARRDMMASSTISMSFSKDEVVKTLKRNRKEHEQIFNEAVSGYRDALRGALVEMESLIEEKRNELEDKKTPSPGLNKNPLSKLTVPRNQLKEYDTVLEMLSLTTDDSIVLDQDQYNCYMKDNWHWMESFLLSNSAYSSTAASKLSSFR